MKSSESKDEPTSKCSVVTESPMKKISSSNNEEAKGKVRKRKERQESVSSLNEERKVIRSNSEERPVLIKPIDEQTGSIRRVSSSGDFPKYITTDHSPLRRYDPLVRSMKYDDNEHDKTRSHERFSRVKNKKHLKRYKVRMPAKTRHFADCLKKPIQDEKPETTPLKFLDFEPTKDRSPSPIRSTASPTLPDFASLYEQEPIKDLSNQMENDSETLPLSKMLSSPRNSIIDTHRIYLDPNVANTPVKKLVKNPVEERVEKLKKQIKSCKKKILDSEADFEERTGLKPTQRDRINDSSIRTLYMELNKLKREQRQLSEISGSKISLTSSNQDFQSLQDTVNDIDTKLRINREKSGRGIDLEALSAEQVAEEKVATQKALLFLESLHGRPQNKQDRDIVRPFYDRYRQLKQMLLKVSANATVGELATIDENEAMQFIPSTSSSNETESDKTEIQEKVYYTDATKDAVTLNQLHSLSKTELLQQMCTISENKRDMRRKIKEFEKTLQTGGKMITKEDKKPIEELYAAYKKVKSRLRLIEALIGKF